MGAKLGGGKKGRFDLGQNADINVTPFVDVMLVLLIIFMVAAPLATTSIKVDVPPPQANATPPPKEPVFINVMPYGKVFLADKETSLDTLIPDLTAALAVPRPTEERIMIRSDRKVPYKEFMAVMNKLQEGGFLKIGLIAEDL